MYNMLGSMEVSKISETKIKENKIQDAKVTKDDFSQALGTRIPREGDWSGEPGNSKYFPPLDKTPLKLGPAKSETGYNNPDNSTWKEILDKYKIDGIPFKDGEPVFDDVSKGNVKIDNFDPDNRNNNFKKADIELAKQRGCTPEEVKQWRKENNYTWHEKADQTTMQKVPNEVHANVPHSGGISEGKKEQKVNDSTETNNDDSNTETNKDE